MTITDLNRTEKQKSTERRDHSLESTRKYLSRLANGCSLLCSVLGMSLIGFILLGPRSILSYSNVELASSCANSLLVAAFLSGIFGAVLSFKENSKKNSINVKASNAELYEKSDTYKISKIVTPKPLPSQEAIATDFSELKSQKTVSEDLVNNLRRRATTDFSRLAKETNLPADTPKPKANKTSYTQKDELPVARNQLVPLRKQCDIPPFQQCVTGVVSSDVPSPWTFVPNAKAGTYSITEVVATKRVRFLSGDYNQRQEEYEVKQTTTFFKNHPHSGLPLCNISEIRCDQQNKQGIQKVFYSSEGGPKSQRLPDVISKFESLQF